MVHVRAFSHQLLCYPISYRCARASNSSLLICLAFGYQRQGRMPLSWYKQRYAIRRVSLKINGFIWQIVLVHSLFVPVLIGF